MVLAKKILVLGIGQSNFILPLYSAIKKRLTAYKFGIVGLKALFNNSDIQMATATFDELLEWDKTRWSKLQLIKAFFEVITRQYFYKDLSAMWLDGKLSIRSVYDTLLHGNMEPYLLASRINKSDYDILHYHFIALPYIYPIRYLNERFKIITTFWGSDLMQSSGHRNMRLQSQALDRSHVITVMTPDMGNILLSKFGRHLTPKLHIIRFLLQSKIFELMDHFRDRLDWQQSFRMKFKVPATNRIVIIGHSGTARMNHLKIIDSFSTLNDIQQQNITCFVPMTYAMADADYANQVKLQAAKYKVHFIFQESYMSWEDLAQLKLIAEVMIHMPSSDALSGALTEYFYGGGLGITASWLPYNTFAYSGLYYKAYDDFDSLGKFWISEWPQLNLDQKEFKNNIEIIKKMFYTDQPADTWRDMIRNEFTNNIS